MLLAIDIGNTNIKMALFKGKKVLRSWRLTTNKRSTFKQCKKTIKSLFAGKKFKDAKIEAIVICSVVPTVTPIFKRALSAHFKKRPLILGKDIIAPIKNLYRRPEQVGQDRLANALAAFSKYGGPAIVVDFGTALTFDAVSAKGSYLGGVILPGLEISLQALIEHADLLPRINLARPQAILGRETEASMKSGIVYGYSSLVEGILSRLKKKLRPKPLVIATGGAASLLSCYCRSINKIEKNLTLDGLRISYQKVIKIKKQ